MSDAVHPVWAGDRWVDMRVASMAGEALVVPNVAAVVFPDDRRTHVLLQRRDKPGEAVRGRWEVPGGRWRSGEPPADAVAREVEEETGLVVTAFLTPIDRFEMAPHIAFGVTHAAVVNGTDGAYPSLHVVFECVAAGEPRPLPGETADPRWWPVEGVIAAVSTEPETFVWHTRAILQAVGVV